MVQIVSKVSSIVSTVLKRRPTDESADVVGALAGFGNIFGIVAAAIGLLGGISLVPMTAIPWQVTSESPFQWILAGTTLYPTMTAAFMGLLAVGLFLQAIGSKDLRSLH